MLLPWLWADSEMRDAFWTFSLRRLLVGVTILCALLALVANFPAIAFAVVLAIPFVLPTIVVCAGLPWLSSRPIWTFVFTVAGAIMGWVLRPMVYWNFGSNVPDWWTMYSLDLQTHAWPPAVGALLSGLACVMFFPRWKEPLG